MVKNNLIKKNNNNIAFKIYKHFDLASIELADLSDSDLSNPRFVIWPVIPRRFVTAIHRAQIEIIRLLVQLEWKVHLLIADCGVEKYIVNEFEKKIIKYIHKRGIKKDSLEYSFLNEYFSSDKFSLIWKWFMKINSKLIVGEFIKFYQKDYKVRKKQELMEKSILNFISPVLSCAVALYRTYDINYNEGNKNIILSGRDDKFLYDHVLRNIQGSGLGAIYIPELRTSNKKGEDYLVYQEETKPIWISPDEFRDAFNSGNTARWVFQMFIVLSSFPEIQIPSDLLNTRESSILFQDIMNKWIEDKTIPDTIDRDNLINYIWDEFLKR